MHLSPYAAIALSMTPLQRYQSDLSAAIINEDPQQQRIVAELQLLFDELQRFHGRKHDFGAKIRSWYLARRSSLPQGPKGIYLWGGVGRGKTYLMDILCDCLPPQQRIRTHFHRFMQGVHAELRDLQGTSNPLQEVAARIAAQAKVLCFDEFFVLDIGDAMILAGLLEALFQRDVVLVTTSNIYPGGLYENGLQRSRFLPAIDLIKQHTKVLHIGAGEDFRLRTLRRATLYYYPCDASTEAKLHSSFRELAPDLTAIEENQTIDILQRKLLTRICADDVVWFEFDELCDGPRSSFDYVEIAKLFHALILSRVPQLDDDKHDQARRFVNLVDELYDRRVKLIMAAAVPIQELYRGSRLAFEFERTRSRLIEMQSLEYLSHQHRA